MIHIQKTVSNCCHKFAQVEKSFQYAFEPAKQNNRKKTQKLPINQQYT